MMGDAADDAERRAERESEEEGGARSRTLPAVRAHEAMVTRGEVGVSDIVAQREKIKQVMEAVMEDGVHYGKVPGISKPTLLKPGAEVLNVTFRLAPSYHSERLFDDSGHLTVVARCVLTHAPSGMVLGEGEGLCSSRESKYAYRKAQRVCPTCGAETIMKSKYPPRESDYRGASRDDPPGWYCHQARGGCGANFKHDDPDIVNQETGRTANPELADTWNTVLKMADKRALVAAVLNCTAASDIFTQDVEDSPAAAAAVAQEESKPTEAERPNVPQAKSWEEWKARMVELGVPEDESAEWLKQASEGIDLSNDQGKATLFRRANLTMIALTHAKTEAGEAYAADPRPVVRRAFASAFEGLELDGPAWRIVEGEQDRLTKDELVAAAAQAEADDIPF